MEGQNVPVSGNAIRDLECSKSVYKTDKSSSSPIKKARDKDTSLLGQFPIDGLIQGRSRETISSGEKAPRDVGLHSKRLQMHLGAGTRARISGIRDRHMVDGD